MTREKSTRPVFGGEMIKNLAKEYSKHLMPFSSYKSVEDIVDDAEQIFEYHYSDNGYKLAKEFDDKSGYNIDVVMVELLDSVSYDADKILKIEVEKWVKANDIKLDLKVGDVVLFDAFKKNNEEGEIVKLYPETAEYGIWSPSLDVPKGKGHAIYNFEDITGGLIS